MLNECNVACWVFFLSLVCVGVHGSSYGWQAIEFIISLFQMYWKYYTTKASRRIAGVCWERVSQCGNNVKQKNHQFKPDFFLMEPALYDVNGNSMKFIEILKYLMQFEIIKFNSLTRSSTIKYTLFTHSHSHRDYVHFDESKHMYKCPLVVFRFLFLDQL